MMKSKTMMGAGVVLSAVLLAGCQNTREGAAQDAQNAQAASERAAERTAEEAREAGREVSQATENAAEATADAAREAGRETREGMAAAGEMARETGAAVAGTAREAGQVAREGAREAATAGDAAQQTAQIKSALMADASIDSTGIDVDTDSNTKTVTLKGRVATAAQKTRAAQIATQKAPGYTVTNNLQVGR